MLTLLRGGTEGFLIGQDDRGQTSTLIGILLVPPGQAYKQCSRAGTWYVGPGGSEWSNYSTCSTLAVLQTRVKVHLAAHVVSVAALIPAIVIFFLYKQLRVPRVVLHRNLFLSLLLNSSVVAAFLAVVMLRDDRHSRIQSNSLGCVALLLLTKFAAGKLHVDVLRSLLFAQACGFGLR
ncbi:calcitonin gene-related peptide type 1 receptor-like [Penaeus monodon]|uniref:calcitonin gene-related peptide type 1 receptor-like n=1 Tax=Penaeus monodon TaxID=6687 RepID=UPI0018A7A8AF|nr:calcitonin gene-related peptide type 1 receptor-like [Penaeus monodon]